MSHADVPPFESRVSRAAYEGSTVVCFRGDLDLVSAATAEGALIEAQNAGETVVLDLRALRFIDSSGLRVILEAHRRAGQNGSRLQVAPGDDAVRRVFDVSGVGRLLEIVDAPPEGDG
jgi:anti-sigma B factor antagonist